MSVLAACSAGLAGRTVAGPTATNGVTITATVGGHGANGDSILVQFSNTGHQIAFLRRCGSEPLILTQQMINNAWTGGVQNFMCLAPAAPGPIELDAGAALQLVRFISSAGQYRFISSVATQSDLSDGANATSNAFDTP